MEKENNKLSFTEDDIVNQFNFPMGKTSDLAKKFMYLRAIEQLDLKDVAERMNLSYDFAMEVEKKMMLALNKKNTERRI